jgi:hypothetical protein
MHKQRVEDVVTEKAAAVADTVQGKLDRRNEPADRY